MTASRGTEQGSELDGRSRGAPVLFVTGMQRSGTTMVDKLLNAHPDLVVHSQPFPLFFVDVKRRFLDEYGIDAAYPLDHLVGEERYGIVDLTRWLRNTEFTSTDVDAALDRMTGFSGQYTEIPVGMRRRLSETITPGSLHDVIRQMYHLLSGLVPAQFAGGKETMCEEFVPHLLEAGAHVLVIIRDPRDVVCSLNHGRGEAWAGTPKPTLFNVRHWRKSVHLALAHETHPNFHVLRYEDIVQHPAAEEEKIANWLGVGSFPEADTTNLSDQSGSPWEGNSSFGTGGQPTSSIGRYLHVLPAEVAAYVEAATLPELRLLGYASTLEPGQADECLQSFTEPYDITRPGMAGYSEDPANVLLERRRLHALRSVSGLDERGLFLDAGVAGRLSDALT